MASSERIEIKTADGRMSAVLAVPDAAGPRPSVIVLMEAFGLNDNIGAIAARIADEGYVALAPDLYYRLLPNKNVWTYDSLDGAIDAMQSVTNDGFTADMNAALDYLDARGDTTGRTGVTGFCMGGRLSFLAACTLSSRVACAAPFYGGGIVGHLDEASAIDIPLYMFFGEKDPYIPLDQIETTEARLKELGKPYDIEVYKGADHGFFCEERESYDEAAATDSWSKLKTFFATNLR